MFVQVCDVYVYVLLVEMLFNEDFVRSGKLDSLCWVSSTLLP